MIEVQPNHTELLPRGIEFRLLPCPVVGFPGERRANVGWSRANVQNAGSGWRTL